jgi:raffinose/stachyose/melibiose transport system substrate-binding protein
MNVSVLRRGGIAASVMVALLLTSACGDDGGGDGEGGGGTVEWWHIQPEDGALGQVWNQFAEDFNTQNADGAQVNVTPYENDAFKSAVATAIQAGEPPDLFQSWGGGVLAQQVEAGQVMDLTDALSDVIGQISPGALQPYTIDGRVYGLPWNMGMVGFWYNEELFAQAGISEPPATWTEFLDVVRQLKEAGITPIALGGSDLWPGHFWWSYLAMRVAGLEAFEQAGETQSFDHPGFVQAGQLLQELVALEPFQEGFQAVGYEQADGQAATMGNGEAAMELMGHWAPQAQIDWAGLEGEAAETLVDNRGFFPFPEVEGGAGSVTEVFGGGDGFAIGANAPDETLEFVRYVFENYQTVLDTGGIVTVLADGAETVDNPNIAQVLQTLENSTGFQLYLDQNYPPAVGTTVNESVGALIAGQMSPEEVVASINEAWAREG